MADLTDRTQNVNICSDDDTKKVDVITDSNTVNRLAVDSVSSGEAGDVVQQGNAFYLTAGALLTVASGTNFDVLVITGTTKEIHLKDLSVNVLKNAASGTTQFRLYEAPTTSANGSAATIYNNNRRSAITPDFTAFVGPTVTALGTVLINYLVHSDWETYIAPSYTNKWEIILKTNTKYLLRFFNNTNQGNDFTYLYWLFQDAL